MSLKTSVPLKTNIFFLQKHIMLLVNVNEPEIIQIQSTYKARGVRFQGDFYYIKIGNK